MNCDIPTQVTTDGWTVATRAIYFASCSLNGALPNPEWRHYGSALTTPDDDALGFCQFHQITALCAFAFKDTGMLDHIWDHELAFAEYKHVLQAAERDVVLNELEKRHIRHMPLKGTILSELYPNPLMREMCDSDILVDSAKTREVKTLMKDLGFEPGTDSTCHQSFTKQPFLNFEMHRRLFDEDTLPKLEEYYRDIWSMAKLDDGKNYRYHLSPTDFYIYMTLHAYKHYAGAGFGLRTLADEYVMLQRLGGIDFQHVNEAMAQIGTQRFETTLRGLASKLFDKALLADDGQPLHGAIAGKSDVLEPAELRMLNHVVASGSYGTVAQAAQRRINKSLGADMDEAVHTSPLDDARYILQRAFPSVRKLKAGYPVLRHPTGMVLLPGVYAFRLVRGLTTRRDKTSIELNELKKATE